VKVKKLAKNGEKGQNSQPLSPGQSTSYLRCIEYNGDNSPASTGAEADYITLYRRKAGVDAWTARNFYNDNNWEFRGSVTATSFIGNATSATTAGSVTGKSSINKTAHTSGANDYHLELFSDSTGDANKEVSLRFHQGSQYWGQIRFRASQFYFTSGSDNSLYAVNTGTLNATGNITASGGTVTAAGLSITGLATWSGSGYTSYANEGANGNWYIRSGSANGNVILQDTGGRVGIGIAYPTSTLDVNGLLTVSTGGCRIYGTEATIDHAPSQNDYFTNGGSIQGDSPNLNFGLYVSKTIRVQGIVVFSDQRIKSNIVDIHDTTALDQIRLLKPKYYEYVDKVSKGTSSVIGFIAQDVKEVLPRAVSVADGDIPNIYESATISSSNTVTFTNFNTSNLDGLGKLIAYLAEDKREELTITEVVDEHTVRVEEDMSEWGSELFVWGQKVQDFHHLNKDYIFTVATAALQEVDRQLQAEKARNDLLEARILKLETVILNL
jgi:hypothetical protein